MPTEIGPNKSMLYGGIVFQVIVIAVVCYFSYDLMKHISIPFGHKKSLDCFGIIITIVCSVQYVWAFYSMPYWIAVDDKLKTLGIKYFFRKPMLVGRENMLSYNDTTIKVSTRSGNMTYFGFYLHLGDGRKILFSERNFAVEDYVYIESMLAYWGVRKERDE